MRITVLPGAPAHCAAVVTDYCRGVTCNICCYNATITTLIIQETGPKREYPDRGVNWGSTINKGHILNGIVHSFTIRAHNNWRRMTGY